MQSTIYKYELPIEDEARVVMPLNAIVLSVQVQRGRPCLWAQVDPGARNVARYFRVIGTGHPIDQAPGKFLGTIQLEGGALVFHVFEA